MKCYPIMQIVRRSNSNLAIVLENIKGSENIKENDFGIKISELCSEDQQEWLILTEDVPDVFWEQIKDIPLDIPFEDFLEKIRRELFNLYGPKRDQASSFSDSRFTPLSEMIERGMISCGALSSIFSAVLRKFGIPVKLVHGILKSQDEKKSNRHSWLEVFNPKSNSWLEIDPTVRDFKRRSDAMRRKVYHNWLELKPDYDMGEY